MKRYTRQELIDNLKKLSKKLARTPCVRDVKSPSIFVYRNAFGLWNNALKEAGLPINRKRAYTDEELIGLLQELYRKNKKVPTHKTIRFLKDFPDYITFKYHFGNWNNAIRAAGMCPVSIKKYPTYTKKELIDLLRKRYRKTGKSPICNELCTLKDIPYHGIFVSSFGSWNNALTEAGLPINRKNKYSKKELIEFLQRLYRKTKKSPSSKILKAVKNSPNFLVFRKYFGSWNNALKAAGIPLNQRRYTKEELIGFFQRYYHDTKKIPDCKTINALKDYPTSSTFVNRFGGWHNALIAAGLKFDKSQMQKRK